MPGPWLDRLPHFRMGHKPSSGEELQSEYLVPRARAVEAIGRLRAMSTRIAPLLHVSEIRSVAADDLWLSGAHGRDVVALHFTWRLDPAGGRRAAAGRSRRAAAARRAPALGQGLRRHRAASSPRSIRSGRTSRSCAARADPHGRFANAYTARVLG